MNIWLRLQGKWCSKHQVKKEACYIANLGQHVEMCRPCLIEIQEPQPKTDKEHLRAIIAKGPHWAPIGAREIQLLQRVVNELERLQGDLDIANLLICQYQAEQMEAKLK